MINLMQGDCLERMKEIESGSVDLILTDPPYGTTACKWDSIIPLEPMWEQLKRIIKPNGAIVMTASQPFTTTLIASNMKMFKYCWVWNKTRPSNFPLAKKQPMKYHEDICVFGIKSPSYYPQMVKGEKVRKKGTNRGYSGFNKGLERDDYLEKEYKDFYPSSIYKTSNPNNKTVHPTQKPVDLMEYLIKTYTNESETVLDFTMGSGSTGVAAKNLNRKFIGIELDEGYFNIAKERIKNA
ncbi:DNA methylase [Pseudoalteromonas phage C7]|uniref:DNA methylase n=1 Tax=Pseudoalteromonas phage C7 TaxID=2510494 RepID=UPI001018BE8D|nr:DNA methylase [Pseudoalteromonas phage C7]QAY18018.1 DNA methylase [Pseudoalteromonas phage C7]